MHCKKQPIERQQGTESSQEVGLDCRVGGLLHRPARDSRRNQRRHKHDGIVLEKGKTLRLRERLLRENRKVFHASPDTAVGAAFDAHSTISNARLLLACESTSETAARERSEDSSRGRLLEERPSLHKVIVPGESWGKKGQTCHRSAPRSRGLEGHLAGELNDPRIVGVCRARNFCVGGISERSRREGKLRCVEHVKGLRAELQL